MFKKSYLILLFLIIPLFLFTKVSYANSSEVRYAIIEPDMDIDCNWVLVDTTHYGSVIDNNDDTYIKYNLPNIIEILGFNTETLFSNEYISQLKLYSRGRCWDGFGYRPKFDYYWNNEFQNLNEIVELPVVPSNPEWTTNIILDLDGSQSDLDDLKIKYIAPNWIPSVKYGLITEVYIEVEITLGNGEPPEISNWQGIIGFFIIIISIIFLIGLGIFTYYIITDKF